MNYRYTSPLQFTDAQRAMVQASDNPLALLLLECPHLAAVLSAGMAEGRDGTPVEGAISPELEEQALREAREHGGAEVFEALYATWGRAPLTCRLLGHERIARIWEEHSSAVVVPSA